ncbi:MAG: hypothetical protein ABIN67_07730 [Ferruginibacter sp.]
MAIKIIISLMLLAALKLLFGSSSVADNSTLVPIDKVWWDNLSEEWKTILLVNQNFQKQHIDIFKLQEEYINRLNEKDEAGCSEINKSLHELNELKRFSLGYPDLYARAIRTNHVVKNENIDLATLANLDTIYMVNGPADLSPLQQFPHLKVLIINYCGLADGSEQIDLKPLKYLKELKVLHCSSPAIKSLPIEGLVNLEELNCDNSSIANLAPLKKLVNLKLLSVGKIKDASAISQLENLEALYIDGCKQVPSLSRLKKLKKLYISEGELSIINAGYRLTNIDFLASFKDLEDLDLGYTSYKGSLNVLNQLQHLKAVTLPPVSKSEMRSFKQSNPHCVIINSFSYE